MKSNLYLNPETGELEISLFGDGHLEEVALHLLHREGCVPKFMRGSAQPASVTISIPIPRVDGKKKS